MKFAHAIHALEGQLKRQEPLANKAGKTVEGSPELTRRRAELLEELDALRALAAAAETKYEKAVHALEGQKNRAVPLLSAEYGKGYEAELNAAISVLRGISEEKQLRDLKSTIESALQRCRNEKQSNIDRGQHVNFSDEHLNGQISAYSAVLKMLE